MGKNRICAPVPGACSLCAVKHEARDPHDRDSLYYQNRFYQKYRRFPTWEDAMAHCSELTKAYWMDKLRKSGRIPPEEAEKKEGE